MSEHDTAELYRLIRDLTAEVAKLTVAVARIEERQKVQQCSHPGLCNDLRIEVDELKESVSEARGGWKLFLALPAIGAALGVLGAWWAKK
jgi:hypothetical protein